MTVACYPSYYLCVSYFIFFVYHYIAISILLYCYYINGFFILWSVPFDR